MLAIILGPLASFTAFSFEFVEELRKMFDGFCVLVIFLQDFGSSCSNYSITNHVSDHILMLV